MSPTYLRRRRLSKKAILIALTTGWPSRGIKVNFGASDAIEIGGRTQFM